MTPPFAWLAQATPAARRALLAASLGWALDAFDIFLYALILPQVMAALHLSKASAGVLGSLTLLSAAAGGIAFGVLSDRFGRTRALIASVLVYAVFTAACGLSWNLASLAVFRILLGFGVGGEWAAGASLVAESWPLHLRARALALMQSSFAIGYAAAALAAYLALPVVGWRGVFFLGLAPALLTLYIRRQVPEPARTEPLAARTGNPLAVLFTPTLLPLTVALTAMNALCLFAFWGFNLWVPAYLALPATQGGAGFSARTMTLIVLIMQAGMWLGYVTFGMLADRFGRKPTYIAYLVSAAALLVLFSRLHTPLALGALAPLLAFAATGYFSGFAAVTAELYAAPIRSTGQGFTYNTGRIASAVAPFTVGSIAGTHGFGPAFLLSAAAFLAAALLWRWLPETRPA